MTDHTERSYYSISEFVDILRVEFDGELDTGRIVADARLIDDLELDSLQLLRLAAVVESLAPIELPSQIDPADATVEDLHYYYMTLASQADPGGRVRTT